MKIVLILFVIALTPVKILSQYDRTLPAYGYDEEWSKPSLLFVPDIEKNYYNRYGENVISQWNSPATSVSLGETYYSGRYKSGKYYIPTPQNVEIFSFSPESDITYEEKERKNNMYSKINRTFSPYDFESEQDFKLYQDYQDSVALQIPKLVNLKYAKIVYPTAEMLEALLKLPSLKYVLIINPTEKLNLKMTVSGLQTLYIAGMSNIGYQYYAPHIFPFDFNKQLFPELTKLNIKEHSAEFNYHQLNKLPQLKWINFTIAESHISNFNKIKFPKSSSLNLEITHVNNNIHFSDVTPLNVKHFKPLDSLRIEGERFKFNTNLKYLKKNWIF